MPRIRSIKPEFATDGSMLSLSDSCALFFVLLWTHCDDEGKHKNDYLQIAAELGGRWHQGKIKLFVSCLIKSGQLRLNSDSTWLQVVNWSHQKIDKPKQPKVKASELQWLTSEESSKALEKSRRVGARIGSDQGSIKDQGSILEAVKQPSELDCEVIDFPKHDQTKEVVKSDGPDSLSGRTWLAYQQAYIARWKIPPLRNAKVNANITQITKRLGEDAPSVVAFYVAHNSAFYVSKTHDIGLCLKDAESLHTQWVRGHAITTNDVRQFEKSNYYQEQLKRMEKL